VAAAVWLVRGNNGENAVKAEGRTRAEAYWRACQQARGWNVSSANGTGRLLTVRRIPITQSFPTTQQSQHLAGAIGFRHVWTLLPLCSGAAIADLFDLANPPDLTARYNIRFDVPNLFVFPRQGGGQGRRRRPQEQNG